MKNSVQDFIFGDGNTMNRVFRQFSMGAVAMASDASGQCAGQCNQYGTNANSWARH